MHIRRHILLYALLPLVLISGTASFYRFIVANDYIIEYEGACDPAVESCFVGCEDDECEEPYPYKYMHKYAADVREACGPDIADCEAASVCLPEDTECSIEYCDASDLGEGCYTPQESDGEERAVESSEDPEEAPLTEEVL